MNKYHLILVLERLKKGSRAPTYSDVWPWVGMFGAVLLALVTTDCRNVLGVPSYTWHAIFIIALIGSLVMIGIRFYQACTHRKERAKTPEEEVEEIIDQMASDRAKMGK